MVRLVLAISIAALTVLSVLSLDALITGVRAYDQTDCNKGRGDTRLLDCSRIIKSGRLLGKPISKETLAIIHINRGVAYRNKGQFDRAITDYDKAISLNPEDRKAYYNRGLIYKEKGQYDSAIADYDMAIKLDPKRASVYYSRAIAYDKKGDYDRAIADYGKLIKLHPKFAIPYGKRGLVYEKLGQRDKAITDFRKAIDLRPGDKVGTAGLKRLGVTP